MRARLGPCVLAALMMAGPASPEVQAQFGFGTRWVPIPVTVYRPVLTADPSGGTRIAYQPCTTYAWQAQTTSSWKGLRRASGCGSCGVPYAAYPVAAGGCGTPVMIAPRAATGCGAGVCGQVPYYTPAPGVIAAPPATTAPPAVVYPGPSTTLPPASAAPSLSTPPPGATTYPGVTQPPATTIPPAPATTIPAAPFGQPPAAVPGGTRPADRPPQLNPFGFRGMDVGKAPIPQTPQPVAAARQATPDLPLSDVPPNASRPKVLRPIADPDARPSAPEPSQGPQLVNPRDRLADTGRTASWPRAKISWSESNGATSSSMAPRSEPEWDDRGWHPVH